MLTDYFQELIKIFLRINFPGTVEVHACCLSCLPEDVCCSCCHYGITHTLLVGMLGTLNSLLFKLEFPVRATKH